jgi:hypothetical protein
MLYHAQIAEYQSRLRELQASAEATVEEGRRANDDLRRQLEKVGGAGHPSASSPPLLGA